MASKSEYDKILEEWEEFKKTPKGKVFIVAHFPIHLLRGLFLFLAMSCSNNWIRRAVKAKAEENEQLKEKMNRAVRIEKDNAIRHQQKKDVIRYRIERIKFLIEKKEIVKALSECDEAIKELK